VIVWLVVLVVGAALVPLALFVATNLSVSHGFWRLARALGRVAPYIFGSADGGGLAFQSDGLALRETGRVAEAAALAKAYIAQKGVPPWSRNVAIDILISVGEYQAALAAEPPALMPANARQALGLALIQINLAEADYNLGRWDAAQMRFRRLELACWLFPITRAGLLQQRAWIAAHGGRVREALELCAAVKPRWLPATYRAEYHFTRAAAHLAEGRIDHAEAAAARGEDVARRLSSKRNALFLRARVAAARGDWPTAERLCQEAAGHAFRGQGGAGLLLWAQALMHLGRDDEALEALRLVSQRDPESEAAAIAARLHEGGADAARGSLLGSGASGATA
jgi:tetratricopeptide (TPR) repeat protein